jgi:hypothetical protein
MSDLGIVVTHCRKCGKTIHRPASKAGVLFSCGQCQHIQKSPGITSQQQVTAGQLIAIRRAVSRHRLGLAIALPIMAAWVLVMVILFEYYVVPGTRPSRDSVLNVIVPVIWLATGAAAIFLLLMEDDTIRCLSGSRAISFFLFLFLNPIWVIRSVMLYFRVRAAYARLSTASARSDEIPIC